MPHVWVEMNEELEYVPTVGYARFRTYQDVNGDAGDFHCGSCWGSEICWDLKWENVVS